jgi:hypothetical protein
VELGWVQKDVIQALVTYTMMGNNATIAKRVERAANPDKAREITQWLAQKDVKKSGKSGNPITLGRIAKAYAPILILLRSKLQTKLRPQFPTSSPIEQCDIAFLGYSSTRVCSQSRDYVEKFGIIISKVAFPSLSESDLRLRNEGFSKIAQEGLERDKPMRDLLNYEGVATLEAMMKLLHVKIAPGVPTRPEGGKS